MKFLYSFVANRTALCLQMLSLQALEMQSWEYERKETGVTLLSHHLLWDFQCVARPVVEMPSGTSHGMVPVDRPDANFERLETLDSICYIPVMLLCYVSQYLPFLLVYSSFYVPIVFRFVFAFLHYSCSSTCNMVLSIFWYDEFTPSGETDRQMTEAEIWCAYPVMFALCE